MDFETFLIEILTLQNRRMEVALAGMRHQLVEPLPATDEARYQELKNRLRLRALKNRLRYR